MNKTVDDTVQNACLREKLVGIGRGQWKSDFVAGHWCKDADTMGTMVS